MTNNKSLPVPPDQATIDYRGVIEFTFTPDNGGAVTKEKVYITTLGREPLKKCTAIVEAFIMQNHPAMEAFAKEVEAFMTSNSR